MTLQPGKLILAKDYPADADVKAYVAAVEAADGQALELEVIKAYDNFILGCKHDGIWNAIKASCILAGARTTNGALVPLKGTAPTPVNFDLISDTDYDRKTGLVGDASTKYLASNYAFPTSLQNNCHIGGYLSVVATNGLLVGGYGDVSANGSYLSNTGSRLYQTSSVTFSPSDTTSSGFRGVSRNNSSNYLYRRAGSNETANIASLAITHENQGVFARRRNTGSYDGFRDGRLAFYSIGESLDLALLDARVSTLISDLGAAIP